MYKADGEELSFHYVSTRDEARKLIAEHERYWIEDCGCRLRGPGCKRSRIDVCLYFDPNTDVSGAGIREVDREFVEGVLAEAEAKHLITRPFRYEDDRTRILGICFCCDDCCEYFLDKDKKTDKGKFIEKTDMDACTLCGVCEEVCYFNVRKISDGKLVINLEGCYGCYGCGLCTDVCPEDCIEMVERNGG